MTPKVVHVETLLPPHKYSEAQLARARAIQAALDRGKLILAEPPWKP
jgi:hypothetical protein